jgi:hypothetical protein
MPALVDIEQRCPCGEHDLVADAAYRCLVFPRKPRRGVPKVGDHDAAGASRGLGARDRLADSARRTGDDTDFVFDLRSRFLVLTRSFSFGSMN